MNDAIKMQISAFVDGELPQNEAELLLRRLCQDAQLRQQAAEYLAMGRIMRGERTVAGMAMLRERVSAAIDDKNLQKEFESTQAPAPRFMRPLVGVAIAATVALVALLGLQQLAEVPDSANSNSDLVAESPGESYTVPESENDPLLDYYLRHSDSASYIGADSIQPRLVTFPVGEELELDSEDAEASEDDADASELDEPAVAPTP
jgi:hypothetical protein